MSCRLELHRIPVRTLTNAFIYCLIMCMISLHRSDKRVEILMNINQGLMNSGRLMHINLCERKLCIKYTTTYL